MEREERGRSTLLTRRRGALLAVLLAASACDDGGVASTGVDVERPPLGMLPGGAAPLRYRLDLSIDPDQPRFSGTTEIDVRLDQPTGHVWLHARDLAMREIWYRLADGERHGLGAQALRQVTDDGVALLTLDERVGPGEATLGFRYDAPFNADLTGLYRFDVEERWYAVTQFQEISARATFPSFDEPRFKTPFDVVIRAPRAARAFASTPALAERTRDATSGALRPVRFATTPPLPTYLIALAVGPWDVASGAPIRASAERDARVPLRGLAVAGQASRLEEALKGTESLLLEHERYFGIAYPFRKLDIVAVPDFRAGAMENVGLITYRDDLLLLGASPTVEERRSFLLVHSHELAHQWFGNLVTPRWWDDLWLNESFASWAGARAADAVTPELGFRTGRAADGFAAMDADSLASARRVREPVANSGDIANAFDAITYDKGGAVLAMFESYLGDAAFRQGVQRFLQRFRFGTATSDDFAEALADAAGDPTVAAALQSFIAQPGVPLLAIDIDCGANAAELRLRQERYLPLGSAAPRQGRWRIPVCFAYEAAEAVEPMRREHCLLVTEDAARTPLEACPAWVHPNRGGIGYYRWALAPAAREALLAAHSTLSSDEQLALADSVAAGFADGRLAMPDVLEALPVLAESHGRAAVERAVAPLEWAHDHGPPDARDAIARELGGALADRLAELRAAERRSPDEERLRLFLTALLAREAAMPALREELGDAALARVEDLFRSADVPRDDLLAAGLVVALEDDRLSAPRLASLLHSGATTTLRTDLRDAILEALGRARVDAAQAESRRLLLRDELRANERIDLLFAMFAPPQAERAWRWFAAQIEPVWRRIPEGDRRWVPLVAGNLCDREIIAEVRATLAPRIQSVRGAARLLDQAVEAIQICAALRERHGDALARLASVDVPSVRLEN